MNSISTSNCTIHFNAASYVAVNKHIKEKNFSKIFILVDENTLENCLPSFLEKLETNITIEIIEIEAGEINKTIALLDVVFLILMCQLHYYLWLMRLLVVKQE